MADFDKTPGQDRIEALLRQSLHSRAEDVHPDPGTWNTVSDRIRRGRLLRWSLAGAGAVAAIAVAALAVPTLLNRTTVDFAPADPPGGGAESPSTGGACGGPAHVSAVLARTGEGLAGTIWALCDDGSETLLDDDQPQGFMDTNPTLSWDGESLVFERFGADGTSLLVHVDMETGRKQTLMGGRLPSFGSDGRLAWVQPVDQGQDRILVGRPFSEPELEFPVVDGEDGEWFDARRIAWDASGETLYAEIGYETSIVMRYDVGALYRSSSRGSVNGTRLQERTSAMRFAGPSAGPSPSSVAVVERCCSEVEGDRYEQAFLRIFEPAGERLIAALPEGFDPNGALWSAWAPAGPLRQTADGAYTWSGGGRPMYLVGDGDGVWAIEPDGKVTRITGQVSSAATNPALSGDGPGAPPSAEAPEQDVPGKAAATRRRIWQAAYARDYGALEALMSDGFQSSFAPDDGPKAAIVRLRAMEQRGEDPFALILRLLAAPPGEYSVFDSGTEEDTAFTVWPGPAAGEAGRWTEEEVQILRDLGATDADLAGYREYGSYTGWRISIREDGQWAALVRLK